MTRIELAEAVAVLTRILAALSAAGQPAAGSAGADARRAIGALQADASAEISDGSTIGADLANCFALAVEAGATLDGLARAREAIEAETPTGEPGKALAAIGVWLALASEATIISDTDFTSRDEVDAVVARMHAAFLAAEDAAADADQSDGYRALVTLHGATVRDLVARSRPLPQMVSYSFARRFPAAMLANRLYGDASRTDELVAENHPVHPAFMPAAIRALGI
jgi:hypothetical protein